ncbi:MAG: 39S ribosomal protein L45 [Myxococcales bacterium]|jgi:predicted lipid-binding transport protein (Tim44 family)|nr:39S ribosomal protein L45 [Myxococcales bacterium]
MAIHPPFPKSALDRLKAIVHSRLFQRSIIASIAGLALLLGAADALARVGGGHSYSGSSSSGGGGGDGDGAGALASLLIRLLLWLCIEHPLFGIPITIVVVLGFVKMNHSTKVQQQQGWATGAVRAQNTHQDRAAMLRAKFKRLRAIDPAFSRVLFEDFVYFLYAQMQRTRAKPAASMAAYVAPGLLASRHEPSIKDVTGIVIGAMRIQDIHGLGGQRIAIDLRIESNVVEVLAESGAEQRFYLVERLRLMRDASAKSRPAARAQVLDCPNCGAPFDAIRGTTCSYCQQDLGHGRFDWQVTQWMTDRRERRGPLLTETVAETGTELATLRAPDAQRGFAALIERDPALNWDTFARRIRDIWGNLQSGWSERDLAKIRPFVSDNLFQSMVYWIDLYVAQKCRNVTESGQIQKLVLADVSSDETYDAVTVRLFATGLDYTISDDGKLLSGSKSRPRPYSEYWTLIRGHACQGKSKDWTKCPNCGAELSVSMTGNCDYCQAKVTSGDFDWVLSRIEQDESYGG